MDFGATVWLQCLMQSLRVESLKMGYYFRPLWSYIIEINYFFKKIWNRSRKLVLPWCKHTKHSIYYHCLSCNCSLWTLPLHTITSRGTKRAGKKETAKKPDQNLPPWGGRAWEIGSGSSHLQGWSCRGDYKTPWWQGPGGGDPARVP